MYAENNPITLAAIGDSPLSRIAIAIQRVVAKNTEN